MKSLKVTPRTPLNKVISLRPLDPTDPFRVSKSILRSLLTDVNRLRPGTEGLGRDLVTLEARIDHEGEGFLSVSLIALYKAFLKGLEEKQFTTPIGFKQAKGKVPLLFRGIFGDVFDISTGHQIKDATAEEVLLLGQLCTFLVETPYRPKDTSKACGQDL